MKIQKYITLANGFTVSRVLLLPLAAVPVKNERHLWALLVIGFMGLTDLLDGFIARRTNTASGFGAVLDVAADCIVIFTLQIVLWNRGDWAGYIIITSLVSILSFIPRFFDPTGRSGNSKAGKYIGAVLLAETAAAELCGVFGCGIWGIVKAIIFPVTFAYLALMIFENLVCWVGEEHVIKQYR